MIDYLAGAPRQRPPARAQGAKATLAKRGSRKIVCHATHVERAPPGGRAGLPERPTGLEISRKGLPLGSDNRTPSHLLEFPSWRTSSAIATSMQRREFITLLGGATVARQRVRLTSVQLTTVDVVLPPVCM
jgi:hypothetical protein